MVQSIFFFFFFFFHNGVHAIVLYCIFYNLISSIRYFKNVIFLETDLFSNVFLD